MTIDLAGGRFGSVSLGVQDVNTVRQSQDRDHIGSRFSRIWDKIADWFSNTDRTRAKQCLFDLYSPTTTHEQKIESFLALRDMAGANYQARFLIDETDESVRYTLDLGEEECPGFALTFLKVGIDHAGLEQELNRDDYWGHGKVGSAREQVLADIHRSQYSVSGIAIEGDDPEFRMMAFEQALEDLQVTDSEREAIFGVCNQSIIGTTYPSSSTYLVPGGRQDMAFDVYRQDGELRVSVRYAKDLDQVGGEDQANPLDPERRRGCAEQIALGGVSVKSMRLELDFRVLNGDSRAQVEILDSSYRVSWDLDTVQQDGDEPV